MKEIEDSMEHCPDPKIWKSKLKENPFAVPDGYFEQLLDTTSFSAKFAAQQEDNQAWKVPQGYFENLQSRIQSQVALEDTLARSTGGFQVPEGYFESLNRKITEQVMHAKPIATGSSRIRKFPFKTWARYAAAASLLIISTLFIRNWDANAIQETELEKISDQEIISYLSTFSTTSDWLNISAVAVESSSTGTVSDLSDDEIHWFLENSL